MSTEPTEPKKILGAGREDFPGDLKTMNMSWYHRATPFGFTPL